MILVSLDLPLQKGIRIVCRNDLLERSVLKRKYVWFHKTFRFQVLAHCICWGCSRAIIMYRLLWQCKCIWGIWMHSYHEVPQDYSQQDLDLQSPRDCSDGGWYDPHFILLISSNQTSRNYHTQPYSICKIDSGVINTSWHGGDFMARVLVVLWFSSCSRYRIGRDCQSEKTTVVEIV